MIGSGAVGNAAQGRSVALSADGSTAIVGGYRDNFSTGAAWIWTRSGNVWTQQGGKLVGSGGSASARQGDSVAISADGNTAVVGGHEDNGGVGAAWIWIRSGGVWTQQGSKLVGTGAIGASGKGYSVSLSADGNTATVGGPGDDGFTGATWVWTRSGGVWTQQGNKLIGAGAAGPALQGVSVSLAADGSRVLIGGYHDNGTYGASWIWTRTGNVWSQMGNKLVGSNGVDANQGIAVGMSGDGNTAIVGGYFDAPNGAAWIFVPTPDLSIAESINGVPSVTAGSNLNYSISIANSGPGAANAVLVTDVLPAGTTLVSATSSQGSCTGTTTVSCALGGLSKGATASIALVLKSAPTPATVSNTATVTAVEVDLNPANNSSSTTITTVEPASVPAVSLEILVFLAAALALSGTMRMKS